MNTGEVMIDSNNELTASQDFESDRERHPEL